MQVLFIFATVIAVCSAGLYHNPSAYVARVAYPASIPTTVPEFVTSAVQVPEHRFSSSEWVQPTTHVTPAVRQYSVRTEIPVAVRQLSVEPTVQYTSHLSPFINAPINPWLAAPVVQQNIW